MSKHDPISYFFSISQRYEIGTYVKNSVFKWSELSVKWITAHRFRVTVTYEIRRNSNAMVVQTGSGEHLQNIHLVEDGKGALKGEADIFHDVSIETKEKNNANIKFGSKAINNIEGVDDDSMELANKNKDRDATDDRKRDTEGHIDRGYLQEVHCTSKRPEDASEPLLKQREDSFNENLDKQKGQALASPIDDTNLPRDRGWAWVILLASVYAHFIVIGQLKCFGIIFVQLQLRYGSSSSETSLIFTLMNVSYSISALIIMTIGGSLSARKSVFIGATITSIASMITAFIHDVNIAIMTIGVASGVANAFIMPLVATIISEYFVQKRGLANNVGNCGVSLGAIVLAPVVTKLFEAYSYTGTYIILTGLNLQLFIIGCLFRPISFYKRVSSPQPFIEIDNEKDVVTKDSKINFKRNGTNPPTLLQMRLLGKDHRNAQTEFKRQLSEIESESRLQIRRRRTVSESETGNPLQPHAAEHSSLFNSTLARFASTDVVNNSLLDLTLTGSKQDFNHRNAIDTSDESRTCIQSFRRTVINSLKRLFDTKLLSKIEFQYFLVCNVFLCSGSGLVSAFLPPLAFENGVSNDMVALMVSVLSIVEFFSKFVVGYISDKKWCHRSTLIAIASFILGVAAQFLHFTTTFSTIMIYAVISGLLQGVYFSLFVVVILDILSFDEFKGALGFTSLIQGIASGICMPVVGYLRDYTGQYTYPYNFIGSTLIIGAVLIYFVPNVHEWSQKRAKEKHSEQNV